MATTNISIDGSSVEPPLEHVGTGRTVEALRPVIFGAHSALHARVREVVVGLSDDPPSGLTYAQEAGIAPGLLRSVISELGGSARDIAGDAQLRGALCEWAGVAAPRLLPVLTGHFDLSVGAILALGNGSDYQQVCAAELDTGVAMGVLLLTELGGTNGADQLTTATWDAAADGFWLSTPSVAAAKFMPNVADPSVPKNVVVTARLVVDGHDEGVLPFLLRLRTSTGLADGVEVVPLPDKGFAPMDHGMIRFDRVWLPREALLGGDWARMTVDGRFECALPQRRRFHAAISVLGNGRLDLANAAVAISRAALAGLVNYIGQRRPRAGVLMADRDAVQRDMVVGLASVYATSALGRQIRDAHAAATSVDTRQGLWSMLAKPLLSNTAHQVLMMCRQRAAAQATLRINHIQDWIGLLEGIITAEGENQIMQITAGKAGVDITELRLPATPQQLPWYVDMLIERERTIAAALRSGAYESAGITLGRDSAAIELATATAERLAATALVTAAATVADPVAERLVVSAAAAYALERIYAHGMWFTQHNQMSSHRVAEVSAELHRHHTVLAAHLSTMVAAFDIPALPGPIFTADYVRAWQVHTGWDDTTFTSVEEM
ncbi:hypothetical protein [Nocardia sp. NPDC051463]|uniref:hypothetical protein n=1 Tax=Nocardia sp. NPDC051463 TaxID=3154845 RepID=UPI00344D49D5